MKANPKIKFTAVTIASLLSNFALKYFECEYNKMEQLFICYAPQLREAAFEEGNNIDEATKIRMQELIADNMN